MFCDEHAYSLVISNKVLARNYHQFGHIVGINVGEGTVVAVGRIRTTRHVAAAEQRII